MCAFSPVFHSSLVEEVLFTLYKLPTYVAYLAKELYMQLMLILLAMLFCPLSPYSAANYCHKAVNHILHY